MRTILSNQFGFMQDTQFGIMQEKSAEKIILLVIQRIIQRWARKSAYALSFEKAYSRIPHEAAS